ncbi:hypothetical protein ACFLZN_00335 [Nanoarchaeota archaeon]
MRCNMKKCPKNCVYDTVSMYKYRLASLWRIDNVYMKDAKKEKDKKMIALLKEVRKHDVKALELLESEVASRVKK